MPDYDALQEILGKTIRGVIVKQNTMGTLPAVAIHMVFEDGTSYEIYSLYQMSFGKGLNQRGMAEVRQYLNPPMANVLDISVDDA